MTIILYAVAEARRPRHGPEISCLELTGGKKKKQESSNPRKAADEKQYLTLFLYPIFH